MKSDDFDRLRLSYRSMLDKRDLSTEQLKALAAALFVACYATIAKGEEVLAHRDISESEIANHIRGLSESLEQGNVLASLDFLAELPARFEAAREVGKVTFKSESGETAVAGREAKRKPVRDYALNLANKSTARTKSGVLDEIVDDVMDFYLKATGSRLSADRGRATISEWLLKAGFVELEKREATPTR
jgi:hypothetical protein